MGTYVIGGAALFAIGFITYELYEAFKEVASAAQATKTAYANAQQTYSQYAPAVGDATLLALESNPVTMPFALSYETIQALTQ